MQESPLDHSRFSPFPFFLLTLKRLFYTAEGLCGLELHARFLGPDQIRDSFFDEGLAGFAPPLDNLAELFQLLLQPLQLQLVALLANFKLLVDHLGDLLLQFFAPLFCSLDSSLLSFCCFTTCRYCAANSCDCCSNSMSAR